MYHCNLSFRPIYKGIILLLFVNYLLLSLFGCQFSTMILQIKGEQNQNWKASQIANQEKKLNSDLAWLTLILEKKNLTVLKLGWF